MYHSNCSHFSLDFNSSFRCHCQHIFYYSLSSLVFLFLIISISLFFFFSSRRRHTRCLSDWSSDVCSSDLTTHLPTHLLRPPNPNRSRRVTKPSTRPCSRPRKPLTSRPWTNPRRNRSWVTTRTRSSPLAARRSGDRKSVV